MGFEKEISVGGGGGEVLHTHHLSHFFNPLIPKFARDRRGGRGGGVWRGEICWRGGRGSVGGVFFFWVQNLGGRG